MSPNKVGADLTPPNPTSYIGGKNVVKETKTDLGKNVLKYIHPNNANIDCHDKN